MVPGKSMRHECVNLPCLIVYDAIMVSILSEKASWRCLMKDSLPRYTMRISRELLDKLGYISEYKGRTVNKQLEQLVKKCVEEFEREHGKIPPREDRDKL